MKLTFHGTRGNIDARSRRHRRHTVLEVAYRGRAVTIDWGADWRGLLERRRPRAIVVTHAHPDHVGGLADGAPCPVWATPEAWEKMKDWPIEERRTIRPRARFEVAGIGFEAFPLEHSVRAPAVGYRVDGGRATVFYAPDLLEIEDRSAALRDLTAYVGDGATLLRPIVRRKDGSRIGHASIAEQLAWCAEAGVPRMIVTHCGRHIVAGDERKVAPRLRAMAQEAGIRAEIAHDGMEVLLR